MGTNNPLYSLYGDGALVPNSAPAPFTPQPTTFDPTGDLVFTPSGTSGSSIVYTSSPLQAAGYTGNNTVRTGIAPAPTQSSIASILSSISQTVLGGIAISRIPSNQIGQVSSLSGKGVSVQNTQAGFLSGTNTNSILIILLLGVAAFLLLKRRG